MKNFADYRDGMNFIGHFDDEGVLEFGDGLQRLSMEALFRYLIAYKEHGKEYAELFVGPYLYRYQTVFLDSGEPTRHWNREFWFGRAGTCSRDQLRPTFCVLAAMRQNLELKSLFIKLVKRGFFAWNTKHIGQWDDKWKVPDFIGLQALHVFLRAFMRSFPVALWTLWPFLCVLDLILLLNVFVRLIVGIFDRTNCSDDLNLTCDLLLIKVIGPQTPISMFAHLLYFGLMSQAKFADENTKPNPIGVISRFERYFAGPKNPPLDELAKEAILKLS